jgi:hypothetical protein
MEGAWRGDDHGKDQQDPNKREVPETESSAWESETQREG